MQMEIYYVAKRISDEKTQFMHLSGPHDYTRAVLSLVREQARLNCIEVIMVKQTIEVEVAQ